LFFHLLHSVFLPLKHLRKDYGVYRHKAKLAPIMSVKNITFLLGTTWVSYPDREHQMMVDILNFEIFGNDTYLNLPLSSPKVDGKAYS